MAYAQQTEEFDEPEQKPHPIFANLDQGNIVDKLPDNAKAYQDANDLYDEAKKSMVEWLKKYNRAIKLAILQPTSSDQDIESKSFPFQGASLAMMPYILEAMLDFSSRAAPELVWADKVIATKVFGRDFDAGEDFDEKEVAKGVKETKQKRADRVSEYMNYQLFNEIPFWREGQDKLLMMLPCIGTAYKKTYRDYDIKGICSELVRADKLIFDMNCDNFDEALHKFQDIEISRNELIGYIRGEQKWDIDEDKLEEDKKKFNFIEAYTYIDLDEDGLAEPYIAILDSKTQKIVCLYPNYDEDTVTINDEDQIVKIEEIPCFTQYRFIPDPKGGPMGLGWGILLGPMFSAINKSMRQLLDSGTLANASANSGMVAAGIGQGRGNRQEAGPVEVTLGQLTPINMGGINGSLRDNIIQFPFAGPNATLFALLQYMIESARSMTNAAINVEANAGEAASMYLARLEQGLKVPNSIIMRVYHSAKLEFEKIHALDYTYHDSEKYNKVLDEETQYVMEKDFDPDDCDVRLAADPSHGSDIERSARAEANLQLAMAQTGAGIQVMDIRQATIDLLEATKTQNIEELVPEPQEGPTPEMQAMIAQQQMEAELKQKDQELREKGQKLQEMKMAHEAAQTMAELGLKEDEQQAKITGMYAKALKDLVDAGIASGERALEVAQRIEDQFIDSEGGANVRKPAIQAINPNPAGAMAG